MKKIFYILCIVLCYHSSSNACNVLQDNDPSYSIISQTCYPTVDEVDSACIANTLDTSCECRSFTGTVFNTLQGMPDGTYACLTYGPVGTPRTYKIFIHSETSNACSSQRTAASQQCGGDDKYDINETTCVATCKDACSSQRAAAVAECGGTNMYTMDASCNFTCTGNCGSEISALKAQCGVGNYLIDHLCHGECKENCRDIARDACHGIYSPLGNDDAGMFPVKWYDDSSGECRYECKCDNYTGVDPNNSFDFDLCQSRPPGSSCDLNALKSNCLSKTLATINWDTCDYTCDTCATVTSACVAQCPFGGRVPVCAEAYPSSAACICEDALLPPTDPSLPDGDLPPSPDPDSYLPKTCAQHQAACNPSCSFACSTGADGFAHNPRCDCSTSPDPDPDDPDNPPPAIDPESGDDTNGWLSSIKSNTDTFIDQLGDANGWFEGLKHNSDTSLDLDKDRNSTLGNIAENSRRSVDNQGKINEGVKRVGDIVSESGKILYKVNEGITGKGGTNEKLHGMNERLGTIKEGITGEGGTNELLGAIKDGLGHDVGTGVGTYTGNEMSEGGYGTAPADADLPSAEHINSAFGTFVPRADGGSHGQIATSLSNLSINTSGPVCGLTLKIPRLTESFSWEWLDFPVDFCPYESMFSAIGSLLVFFAALNELYKFS